MTLLFKFILSILILLIWNQDSAAVLANRDFLSHFDFHLALRWNAVEATTT